MMTLDEIRDLVLSENMFANIEPECAPDTPLDLDSMSLIWLITRLEERYDIAIDYREVDLSHFSSIRAIHAFVSACLIQEAKP
ncbi:MAG: hypothetical protein IPP19_14245 [Verrucomicrobia bacterium]|nr:hypothetical protein [Verrucomicrobiota bacterium]